MPVAGRALVGDVDLDLDGAPELVVAALGGTWPSGFPSGALLAAQCWLPDTHGPAGFGASNGVLFLVP